MGEYVFKKGHLAAAEKERVRIAELGFQRLNLVAAFRLKLICWTEFLERWNKLNPRGF